jgi:PKD repeat protein
MKTNKLFRIAIVLFSIGLGLFLVFNQASPSPETSARENALLALGPQGAASEAGGLSVSDELVEPVVVNLHNIPAGVYDPDNQYDRWLRGEIDLDQDESIVGRARIAELLAAAEKLAPSPRLAEMRGSGSAPIPNGPGFDSLDINECCGGGANVPPDPELAVGPNHIIAVVNVSFEIYDKTGTTLFGPATFFSFFGGVPNCTGMFDPNVLYDEEADRFIIGVDANGSHYCVGVSQTSDPTGSWNMYAFNTGTFFFDYPHAGVGRDAIYMGGNMFSGSFVESRVWAFDKWAMYNGAAAASTVRALPSTEDTPQPLNLHGYNQGTWPASGPHYFLTDRNYNGKTYSLWSWADPFSGSDPALVTIFDLQAIHGVTVGYPVNVIQDGGGTITANDYRPQDFEYRNGYAWSTMTVSCNPGGGTVNCQQWAQIDLAGASVVQAGVYASSGEYRFFGDLAVDSCNNMALGYTKSSASMFPSVWFTGRLSTDPPGVLQSEAELKAGEINYIAFDSQPRRWGDYSGMTIDPDGTTFWYLGEYSKITGNPNGRWGNWIGSFTYDCNADDNPPTVSITSPADGAVISGTVTFSSSVSDDFGIDQVEFFAGAESLGLLTDGSEGWSVPFDTTLFPNDEYTLTVVATDTIGQTGSDSISVTIQNNMAPTALFIHACSGLVCTFDASGSFDLDGDIDSYEWDFGDSSTAMGQTAEHGYAAAGEYTVTLTVADDLGALGSLVESIEVVDNLPTISIISPADGAVVSVEVAIEVDANDDGGVTQVEFFLDGVSLGVDTDDSDGWSILWDPTDLEAGNYLLSATATDTNEQTASDSISLRVNKLPQASFTFTCTGPICSFDGSASSDPDGTIESYVWDFGDGSSGVGAAASHTFNGSGVFTVVLTVTDNDGAHGTASEDVSHWALYIPLLQR